MRNFLYTIISLAFICCGCSSSSDKGGGSSGSGGGSTTNSVKISSGEKSTISSEGGDATIVFTTDGDWTVTNATSWCNVTPKSGNKGTNTITVSADPNTSYSERNTMITIKCGKASAKATISQKQNDAILVSSNKIELDYNKTTFKIEVKSNITYEYSIKSGSEWLHEGTGSDSKALSSKTISFYADENWEDTKREGEILVTNGTISETVKVYQQASVPRIVLSQDNFNLPSSATEIKIEIKSNCEYTYTVPEVEWIKEIVESKTVSSYTHRFSISANDTYDNRSAQIVFHNEETDKDEIVTVNQAQINAIIIASEKYNLDAKAQTIEFTVNTNIDFDVVIKCNWISLNKDQEESKVLTEVPLKFDIAANTLPQPREDTIYLEKDDIIQKIAICQEACQDKMTISFTYSGKDLTIPELQGANANGSISINGETPEEYVSQKSYTFDNTDEKSIRIDSWSATGVKFKTIEAISDINIEVTKNDEQDK